MNATSFWSRFSKLCGEKGMSVNAVIKTLQIPAYVVRQWKSGIWPHGDMRKRLAEFFDVTEQSLTYTPQYNMRTDPPDAPHPSSHEWSFIQAYRRNPHLQASVEKLLEFSSDDEDKTKN
jgi:hypothetical protein